MTSYERYIQTEKGKAARRKALDNWNAKRNKARAAQRAERLSAPRFVIDGPVSSVFELGSFRAPNAALI